MGSRHSEDLVPEQRDGDEHKDEPERGHRARADPGESNRDTTDGAGSRNDERKPAGGQDMRGDHVALDAARAAVALPDAG